MTTTTYPADRTALLIVDPYNDFMSQGGKFYEATRETAKQVLIRVKATGVGPCMGASRCACRTGGHKYREKPMVEEGMLSILRHGTTYQVRYASSNPYDRDRQPYTCSNEHTVVTLLQHCGLDPWSITQAVAELRQGRMAVLPFVFAQAHLQAYFPVT